MKAEITNLQPSGMAEIADRDAHPPRWAAGTGFRLPLHLKQMGDPVNCRHRSGWPYVMQCLRALNDPNGMLLDDFVERSFQHPQSRQEWREPWVGIFHHPPGLPAWLDPSAPPDVIISSPEFTNSLPYLRGAIALSEHLGRWLTRSLGCPVLVLKHPTEIPPLRFSMEALEAQAVRRLIQVGWYGRNQRAIYQVAVPPSYQKIHLFQDRPWVRDAIARTDARSPWRDMAQISEVKCIKEVDNNEYDFLLSTSIVFNQYWDVSASNTVIESLARGTPMVVNRHPALEEYLGSDYPLFYDHVGNVEGLLRDDRRLAAAAQHMAGLDKSWMSAQKFGEEVTRFVRELATGT